MVKMLLGYELPEVFHPFQVIAFHEAAPLTYEDRSNIFFCDIEPVIVPCVFIKRFICKTALKPRLFIDSRAVIVRRIYDLLISLS